MTDILGPANAANSVTIRPGDTRVWTANDSFFRDCSSELVNDGTDITAAWLNGITSVLRALWRANGKMNDGATPVVAESGSDDNGVVKSINQLFQRNQAVFALDTSGVAGTITATLVPAPVEYKRGMRVFILMANTVAGAAVMNLNGLGGKPVTRRDGSNLLDGDLVAGGIAELVYDGAKWQVPAAWGRPLLSRETTIYVNGAIGNDANDGTANDASHALKTVQGAINLAFKYGPSPFVMTISIAAGTYNEVARTPLYAGPSLILDGGIKENVIIDGGANSGNIICQGPNTMIVQNLTVQNAAALGNGGAIAAAYGGTVTTRNTASGSVGGAPVFEAYTGGYLLVGSHTFKGSCHSLFYTLGGGTIQLQQSAVFAIANPITVSEASVFATSSGGVFVPGSLVPTWVNSGYVTGRKFECVINGYVASTGNGPSYFPGTLDGVTNSGGQYL